MTNRLPTSKTLLLRFSQLGADGKTRVSVADFKVRNPTIQWAPRGGAANKRELEPLRREWPMTQSLNYKKGCAASRQARSDQTIAKARNSKGPQS